MSHERRPAEADKSGGGTLFVVSGEPDIARDRAQDGTCTIHLRGVDIFDPTTGEVRSSGKVEDAVACRPVPAPSPAPLQTPGSHRPTAGRSAMG